MNIGQAIKEQQPEVYRKLKKKKKRRRRGRKKERLSFSDVESLMREGCYAYKRGKGGAYRQVR